MDMRNTLRFLHRGQVRSLANVDPTQTVLRFLRETDGLTGTKEGCAEGDCGACTVVVGRLQGERVEYRALNSCIMFLPTLDGCHLLTVEDLRAPDDALHPVQQAMVDQHGSQCGFCTPGFVMSLFAAYHSDLPPERQPLADALAGNLCRCTGYRPILDAGIAALSDKQPDQLAQDQSEVIRQLREIAPTDGLALENAGKHFFAPATSDELAALLSDHPDAQILAGGTDVGLWVTKEHRRLDTVIYLGNVRDLQTVTETPDAFEIGTMVTYTDAFDTLATAFPDMGELLRRLGGLQVRNAGTIGGNIANASPIGDTPPPLLALGATLVLRHGPDRRTLPLEDYFKSYRQTALAPGEFIEGIHIPKLGPHDELRVYKISKRFDQDISAVCAAFWLRKSGQKIEDVRIGFGGMAAIPKRAHQTEQLLRGAAWNEATMERALPALDRDFSPLTDFRSSAEYRRVIARNLLRKFFVETTTSSPARVLEYA